MSDKTEETTTQTDSGSGSAGALKPSPAVRIGSVEESQAPYGRGGDPPIDPPSHNPPPPPPTDKLTGH